MAHKYKILSGSVLLALLGYATYSIASPNNLERSYTLASSSLLPKAVDEPINDAAPNTNTGEDENLKPSPVSAEEFPEEEDPELSDEALEEDQAEIPILVLEDPASEEKPTIQPEPEKITAEETPPEVSEELPSEPIIEVEVKENPVSKDDIILTPEIKVVEPTEPTPQKKPKEAKEPKKDKSPKVAKKPAAKPRNKITTDKPKQRKQTETPKGQKSETHSSGTGKSGSPITISGNPESVKKYKKDMYYVGNQWGKDLLDTSNPEWWTVNEKHIITNGTENHFKTKELKEIYRELKDKNKENLDGNRLMKWCESKYKHIYKDQEDPIADDIWFACRIRKSVETASVPAHHQK